MFKHISILTQPQRMKYDDSFEFTVFESETYNGLINYYINNNFERTKSLKEFDNQLQSFIDNIIESTPEFDIRTQIILNRVLNLCDENSSSIVYLYSFLFLLKNYNNKISFLSDKNILLNYSSMKQKIFKQYTKFNFNDMKISHLLIELDSLVVKKIREDFIYQSEQDFINFLLRATNPKHIFENYYLFVNFSYYYGYHLKTKFALDSDVLSGYEIYDEFIYGLVLDNLMDKTEFYKYFKGVSFNHKEIDNETKAYMKNNYLKILNFFKRHYDLDIKEFYENII